MKTLGKYLAGRILLALVTVWLVATATFFLMHAVPGGPFDREKPLPASVRENLATRYHLDRPLEEQYLVYIRDLARGNFGPSYRYPDRPVGEMIREGLRVSALLGGVALLIALILGTACGLVAARRRGGWMDRATTLMVSLALSFPNFVLGALLINIFAVHLHWLPAARWGTPAHVVMPALALAVLPTTYTAHLVRAGLRETLAEEYVLAARGRGLPLGAVLRRHALPNALLPLAGYLAPLAAYILTGSFVIENLFAVPGLGREFVSGVLERDYGMIMGLTVFMSILVVSFSLIADLIHTLLDPRLRPDQGGQRP